jgi:tetratricopeptide (TPR) repeat protein
VQKYAQKPPSKICSVSRALGINVTHNYFIYRGNMTKRIMQHQLEDLSRYKFALSIPPKWVFRDKDKDYGIDGEVEIFNSEERATGLVFWVQLKATSSDKTRAIKGFDLSIETIKYYKRLEIPVLIARYSKHEDTFYVKWAHQIDTFYAKEKAKTMRVSFSEFDTLDEEKTEKIHEYLTQLRLVKSGSIQLPISVRISFTNETVCGVASSILLSKIRSEMNDFSNVLRLETDPKALSADIVLDESTLKVGFLDIVGCTFHSVDLMDVSTLAIDLIKDISLALSLSLSQLGYSDLAARIIFSYGLHDRLKTKHEVLERLLPCLLKSNYLKETLEMVNDVCDSVDNNFLEVITNSELLFMRNTKDLVKQECIEKFLKKNIERYKEKSPDMYGISQYNLGNFYRSTNKCREAVKCLLIARRYEPKYYNQEYFYRELAGALFELGKFTFAANFYKKAIEMDPKKSTSSLYADSLMFAGKYKEAYDVFESYLHETGDQHAGWHLKSMCLSLLLEEHNIKDQCRNIKKAINLADVKLLTPTEAEEQLEKALEEDLLCGLAWFNLAHHNSNPDTLQEAAFCYTMCALVQTSDIEAWVNATACSFNKIVPVEVFALLIRAGYFYNGENYIAELYEMISAKLGSECLGQIANAVEALLADERKTDTNTPELRVLNEKGQFENMLSNKNA